jgi:hypothetical protein
MNQTVKIRLGAALLACGFVLAALPLAQALADPVPPAPPVAPAPPEAPLPPHMEKRVVIINHTGEPGAEAGNEAGAHTRVITRDGKTIVIKTDKPLSDEEIERRIADAEAGAETGMPAPPEPPLPPGAQGRRIEKRIVVRDGAGGEEIDIADQDCAANRISEVDASGEQDGKRTRVKIRICGDDGERMADAVAAVRRARDDVAKDASLPADVRTQILGELDAEIARLERKPG